MCTLATGEISIFQLVSVAEETGLKLALSETRRQVLSRRGPLIETVVVIPFESRAYFI